MRLGYVTQSGPSSSTNLRQEMITRKIQQLKGWCKERDESISNRMEKLAGPIFFKIYPVVQLVEHNQNTKNKSSNDIPANKRSSRMCPQTPEPKAYGLKTRLADAVGEALAVIHLKENRRTPPMPQFPKCPGGTDLYLGRVASFQSPNGQLRQVSTVSSGESTLLHCHFLITPLTCEWSQNSHRSNGIIAAQLISTGSWGWLWTRLYHC